jgi:hypothetical protein
MGSGGTCTPELGPWRRPVLMWFVSADCLADASRWMLTRGDLERFLAWSEEASPERWIEADEGDVLAYLDDLRCRASSWNQCGAEACAPSECGAIRHSRIAEALSPSMWSLSVSCRSI